MPLTSTIVVWLATLAGGSNTVHTPNVMFPTENECHYYVASVEQRSYDKRGMVSVKGICVKATIIK